MTWTAYAYENPEVTRYAFISTGKKRIQKVVEFSDVGIKNTFNLGFGDLLPDGTIDDLANSNNGDIVKILASVISIVKDFVNLDMSVTKKKATHKRAKKKPPTVIVAAKTNHSAGETLFPEKVRKVREVLTHSNFKPV
jgi:hypothetical protein